jgi:hypothetical protein
MLPTVDPAHEPDKGHGEVLKIHELTGELGELVAVYLRAQEGTVELVDADGAWPLPPQALERALARYGAPFDVEAPTAEIAILDLGDGRRLRHVRHLAGYDVVPRDYLVLEGGPGEAPCAMGAAIVGPLQHLARVARARSASK